MLRQGHARHRGGGSFLVNPRVRAINSRLILLVLLSLLRFTPLPLPLLLLLLLLLPPLLPPLGLPWPPPPA